MTRVQIITLAGAGSASLLIGAWGFQLLGYAPCQMCLWQRWPHIAAVVIAVLATQRPLPGLIILGALAAATTAGLGAFHAGVEQGWWPGPSGCTGGGSLIGLDGASLLSVEDAAPVVLCDEIAWSFAGLSMAAWNALLSLGLAALWLLALQKPEVSSSTK